jgi:hypothetical protein
VLDRIARGGVVVAPRSGGTCPVTLAPEKEAAILAALA